MTKRCIRCDQDRPVFTGTVCPNCANDLETLFPAIRESETPPYRTLLSVTYVSINGVERPLSEASTSLWPKMIFDQAVEKATRDLEHGCDGPVTCFVVIGRALRLAEAKTHHVDILSEALHDVLTVRGWLQDDGSGEVPGS